MAGTTFSIETLMTVAAVGAVFIGATEEAVTVVLLFLIGELLEGVAAGRARARIQDLTKLVPKTAQLEDDGGEVREVEAETLAVGATIQVRPGDRIAADGVIVSGECSIDEAPVTGESNPVRKRRDENVFAGTVNGDGLLRVRVTAAAADNTIARVVKLVEEAQESKAPTERFIDHFSRYYTPVVVVVAALVAIVPPLLFGLHAIDSVRRRVFLRGLRVVGALSFAFLPVSAALADEHRVDRVSVFERGIYRASGGSSPIAVGSFGSVTKVRDVSLVQGTTTVLARKSLRFGLRYAIVGSPSGAPVDIRL